ncbi:MAG: SDR family oxidoreductase [Desulfovibrionales bacterium]|nr:SDR family oxidoreductase [Desulfovibrionales bacterium]
MGILEKMSLKGKTSFVTGGARGIGKQISIGLAEAGSNVVIVDIDIEESQKTAEFIKETTGVSTKAIKADCTKKDEVDAMIAAIVEEYGKIDAAFCNAGICRNIPFAEMSVEDFQQVVDINLTGVFITAQAAAKQMLKQGFGSIINTASMSGHIVNVPQPQCSYNASKAGVIMLTKSMAVELAKTGVRVNSISPGYIATELINASEFLKPLVSEWKKLSPMGRLGTPEELQSIAVYLAGDSCPFCTGSDFTIDGAFTCF